MGTRQGKPGSKLGKSRNEVGEVQEIKQPEWSGDMTRYMYNLQRISYAQNCHWSHLPRSRVIPLSLLWGFLSNEAVDATVLRALARGEEYTV